MCETCKDISVNSGVQLNQYDPTHTTTLRNRWAGEMRSRFNELVKVVRMSVDDEDCFGLKGGGEQPQTFQANLSTAGNEAFMFSTSGEKVNAFMRWFRSQVDAGILEVREFEQIGSSINQAWTNKYVYDSYKRGVIRARYELRKAGFDVPTMEATGGVEVSMGTPFHLERVGVLYSRVFEDLRGITTQMDTQISRVLSQGLIDGDGPRLLARKLVGTINGSGIGDLGLTDTLGRFIPARRRAEILARTEVIRAHHQANIQEYKNWRAENVYVVAEFLTAGDSRVCDRCAAIAAQGKVYTLEEIQNIIPVHPQCRCIALPTKKKPDVSNTGTFNELEFMNPNMKMSSLKKGDEVNILLSEAMFKENVYFKDFETAVATIIKKSKDYPEFKVTIKGNDYIGYLHKNVLLTPQRLKIQQARIPYRALTNKLQDEYKIGNLMSGLDDPDMMLIANKGKDYKSWMDFTSPQKYMEHECHWNTVKAYVNGDADSVVIGFYKDTRNHGWVQHTWGLKNGKVLDPTPGVIPEYYFGYELKGSELSKFIEATNKYLPGQGKIRTGTSNIL